MPEFASPLRYPGGKEGLSALLGRIIELNRLQDGVYAEPYAGGAGAGLRLLYGEFVSRILLNDLDYCINAFWRSVLGRTNQFLELLDNTPVTIEEWHKQRGIYLHPKRHSRLRVGFATFFLNRCNRSGILVDGGPIGGLNQTGKWKVDVRFYRETMRTRIERIAAYKDRVEVFNLDAIKFLRTVVSPLSRKEDTFVYLDPPYYTKGNKLYLNFYEHSDHKDVGEYLKREHGFRWVMSYDNVAAIRRLYQGFRQVRFGVTYTAYKQRAGRELIICRHDILLPKQIRPWIARRSIA